MSYVRSCERFLKRRLPEGRRDRTAWQLDAYVQFWWLLVFLQLAEDVRRGLVAGLEGRLLACLRVRDRGLGSACGWGRRENEKDGLRYALTFLGSYAPGPPPSSHMLTATQQFCLGGALPAALEAVVVFR